MQGWRKGMQWSWVGLVLLGGVGCARHAISESLRQQADSTVSFAALQAHPTAYLDRIVIVGGTIVSTDPVEQGTLVTVVQHPLDHHERPGLTDATAGRFVAQCEQYFDPAVYTSGRQITVAGRVLGSIQGKVGQRDYDYPLVSCLEARLWPLVPDAARYDPWYPHYRPHHHYW